MAELDHQRWSTPSAATPSQAQDWNRAARSVRLTAGLSRIGRFARGYAFGVAVRAFTITMSIITLVAFGAAVSQIAHAHADVLCAHRGYAHVEHHGGKAEDDRFHIMHHELPSCDHDKHQGKADEAEHEVHDAEHAEHDLPHLHRRDKLGPHEHHHKL